MQQGGQNPNPYGQNQNQVSAGYGIMGMGSTTPSPYKPPGGGYMNMNMAGMMNPHPYTQMPMQMQPPPPMPMPIPMPMYGHGGPPNPHAYGGGIYPYPYPHPHMGGMPVALPRQPNPNPNPSLGVGGGSMVVNQKPVSLVPLSTSAPGTGSGSVKVAGSGEEALSMPVTVYVGKIPLEIQDSFVRQLLEACGPVIKWNRTADPETNQLKSFGLCTYASPQAAIRALLLLDGLRIDYQTLVLKVGKKDQPLIDKIKDEKQKEKNDKDESEFETESPLDKLAREKLNALVLTRNLSGGIDGGGSAQSVVTNSNQVGEESYETGSNVGVQDEEGSGIILSEIEKFRQRQAERTREKEKERKNLLDKKIAQAQRDKDRRVEREAREVAAKDLRNQVLESLSKKGDLRQSDGEEESEEDTQTDISRKRYRSRSNDRDRDRDRGGKESRRRHRSRSQSNSKERHLPPLPAPHPQDKYNSKLDSVAEEVTSQKNSHGTSEGMGAVPVLGGGLGWGGVGFGFSKKTRIDLGTNSSDNNGNGDGNDFVALNHKKQSINLFDVEDEAVPTSKANSNQNDFFAELSRNQSHTQQIEETGASSKDNSRDINTDSRKQFTGTKQTDKEIAESIPKDKTSLFAFPIRWSSIETKRIVLDKMEPWVTKKIVELLGEAEDTLIKFIISQLINRATPQHILAELRLVLDEDAEVFVVKMWRILVFHMLRVENQGLM